MFQVDYFGFRDLGRQSPDVPPDIPEEDRAKGFGENSVGRLVAGFRESIYGEELSRNSRLLDKNQSPSSVSDYIGFLLVTGSGTSPGLLEQGQDHRLLVRGEDGQWESYHHGQAEEIINQ